MNQLDCRGPISLYSLYLMSMSPIRTALVTASGRGIGNAIAMRLAKRGTRVVINSRSQSDLDSTLSLLGSSHRAFCADLTKEESLQAFFHFCEQEKLSFDVIVHNLGGTLGITDPFCPLSDWHKVMRANLDVAIELNNYFVPAMIQRKFGRVCHISSISALENQGPPTYCAAKAALTAYVRSFGRYVSKDGVVVTSVLPGPIFAEGNYWDESSRNRPEHVQKFLTERMAIQRLGTPEEIASVVDFLCSEESSFCVGSAFVVDGGQGRSFYTQDACV